MWPLAQAPIFASADSLIHLYRFVELDRAIRGGALYPRLMPDLLAGYGYPMFVFHPPLAYFVSEAAHLAGLGYVDAFKFTIALGMLLSTLGMYMLGRQLWGAWGGFLSALAYLYVPYRLVNTYLDGEVPATFAWAWLPWLLLFAFRYFKHGRVRDGVLAGCCYAGVLYTHVVTAWLDTLFLGLLVAGLLAVRTPGLARSLRLAGFLGLGFGLAAPAWLPALAEQYAGQLDRARTASYDFHTNLLPLARTLSTDLVHNYAGYVGVNGPAQLGLVQTAVAGAGLLAVLAAVWWRRKAGRQEVLPLGPVVAFAALAACFFVLMLVPAAAFWDHFPFGSNLQFPDRLLAQIACALAVLTGGLSLALLQAPLPLRLPLLALLAAGIVYSTVGRLQPSFVYLPPDVAAREAVQYEQLSRAVGMTARAEFTPAAVGLPPLSSPLVDAYLRGEEPSKLVSAWLPAGVEAEVMHQDAIHVQLRVQAASPSALTFPIALFPGWRAQVNGVPAPVSASSAGLIQVAVPAGASTVSVWFGLTPDRLLADALALLSLLALAGLAAASAVRGRTVAAATAGIALSGGLISGTSAAAGGVALLCLALALTPGRIDTSSGPSRPEDVAYAGGLRVLGSDTRLSPSSLHVDVRLAIPASLPDGLSAEARLLSQDAVWGSASEPLAAARAGVETLPFDLSLASGTPSGSYELDFTVRQADGTELPHDPARLTYELPIVGAVTLGPVTLPAQLAPAAGGQLPATSAFGPLHLDGWLPPARAEQGGYVPFNLWWTAAERPPADWSISLRVLDQSGTQWASHDDQPRQGYNPTSLWSPGAVQRDVQMILLPAGIPPGRYELRAGWYNPRGGGAVGPQGVLIGTFDVQPAARPDPAKLNVPHALAFSFPQGLDLLGYDLPTTSVAAGEPLPLRLFWQVAAVPSADYSLRVRLADRSQVLPLPGTSRWIAGELVETRLEVRTDAGWSGTGQLELSLVAGQTAADSPAVRLPPPVSVSAVARLTELPPGLDHAAQDTLAGAAQLAGYSVRSGGSRSKMEVTLYWRKLAPLAPDLHVFVHLLDGQGRVVAQHDGVPAGGKRPTSSWTDAEYVADRHILDLPADASGSRQLEVGLYDPVTGRRLGDRLLLGPVSFPVTS